MASGYYFFFFLFLLLSVHSPAGEGFWRLAAPCFDFFVRLLVVDSALLLRDAPPPSVSGCANISRQHRTSNLKLQSISQYVLIIESLITQ